MAQALQFARLFLILAIIAGLMEYNEAQRSRRNRECDRYNSFYNRFCLYSYISCATLYCPRDHTCCMNGCAPICVRRDTCPARPSKRNFRFDCSNNRRRCSVSCRRGYSMRGRIVPEIRCRRNAWRPSLEDTRCRRNTCQARPSKRNFRFDCSSNLRRCSVSCMPGYTMRGTTVSEVRCRNNGWRPRLDDTRCRRAISDSRCPSINPGFPGICSICPTTCPGNQICCPTGCGSTCITPLNTCSSQPVPRRNFYFSCGFGSFGSNTCAVLCQVNSYMVGTIIRQISCQNGVWQPSLQNTYCI